MNELQILSPETNVSTEATTADNHDTSSEVTIQRKSDSVSQPPVESVNDLLDTLDSLTGRQQDSVSIDEVMDAIGRRSYAPILLTLGIVIMTPGPASIPGVPVLLGCLVAVVSLQMILRRDHLWIPAWLERREVSSKKFKTTIQYARAPAKWMDAISSKRMKFLVNQNGVRFLGALVLLVALSTPVLELIPFTAHIAGAIITALALSIVVGDGLIAAIAMGLFAISFIGIFCSLFA